MGSEDRLKRLRELLDQLERLPATAERDRMLREVRARVVDVDTGVETSALLPVHPDSMLAPGAGSPGTRAPRAVAAPRSGEGRRPQPTAKPVDAPPRGGARPAEVAQAAAGTPTGADDGLPLGPDELLSLDDSAPPSPSEGRAGRAAAPWTRGLRG